MIQIPISNIPNQEFSMTLAGNEFFIQLRTIQDLTYMSCSINGEPTFYSQICTPNNWVNQYKYISAGGKFAFRCIDDEYPNYKKFNSTQFLYFITQEEIDQNAPA